MQSCTLHNNKYQLERNGLSLLGDRDAKLFADLSQKKEKTCTILVQKNEAKEEMY